MNGNPRLKHELVRSILHASSPKQRIPELHAINAQLESNELETPDIHFLLSVFLDIYPYYIDRNSRRAVEQCIRTIALSSDAVERLKPFIAALLQEAAKTTIAAANAFVLLEWFSLLLSGSGTNTKLWKTWGVDIVAADAKALEFCMGNATREGVRNSALVVTRRAFRKLFQSPEVGTAALDASVEHLTAKSSAPTARNAVLLGVLAGVAARLPRMKTQLEKWKPDYYSFYTREIIGSRTVLAPHMADGLRDFFTEFTTKEEVLQDIIPAVEKALLRSPEVVLNDLLTPLIHSIPASIDLSEILLDNLTKPLLSNVKSSNPLIRMGALLTFKAAASRSEEATPLAKVSDEILNPLKQSKVTSTDQKIIYLQMLAALKPNKSLSEKLSSGLAPIALKEPNDAAAAAEISTISTHTSYLLSTGVSTPSSVLDAFKKGINDKKIPLRRAWAISASQIIWELEADQVERPEVLAFSKEVLPKLADSWSEVLANPLPAAQNGLVTIAYIFLALCQSKFRDSKDGDIASIIKKAAIAKQVLVAEPKPSFLLNFRIYSKLTAVDDFTWGLRALASMTEDLAKLDNSSGIEDAWSQAFLFLMTSATVPPFVRTEAARGLASAYATFPARIGRIIINGLWEWRRRVVLNEKDTAAVTARTGNSELYLALRSICLSQGQREELNASIDEPTLNQELIDLLVICRPQLLPRANWISTCLRTGVDPGTLVSERLDTCISAIVEATANPAIDQHLRDKHAAAFAAAADLAFVSPEVAIPRIVQQIESDLDTGQLSHVGPTEAGIYRTPEGAMFVDVLASKSQPTVIDKNIKDYDTLKWESELRAQLEAKKGKTKKLSPVEQAKVNDQLAKESKIRSEMTNLAIRLGRGVGIVRGLATGPPTEAERWIVAAIDRLIGIIDAGAGLLLDDAAAQAYISCAERVSPRLGPLRPFIGIATLRAIGVTQLPAELTEEPLDQLVTRVLYRLRFLGEQRPLDTVSLAYCLPLVFIVLEQGGVAKSKSEEADEQIVLALEILTSHTDTCTDERLPRRRLLSSLVSAMQRFTQHFELVKTCFDDLVRALAASLSDEETAVLLKATIVPEKPVRTASLQAIDAEVDLSGLEFSEEIWIASHDDVEENVELGKTIWEENDMQTTEESALRMISYLERPDKQLRRAAARALAEAVEQHQASFPSILSQLQELYTAKARPLVPEKDKFGMVIKKDVTDLWEARDGTALAFKQLASTFETSSLVPFCQFLVGSGPLGDRNATVRREMVEAATDIIAINGKSEVEPLMELFEGSLEGSGGAADSDQVNEAVVILYGALARHLPSGDSRLQKVVQRLLATLRTPSEDVQYAVALCLPPLVQASKDQASSYAQQMMDELLQSKKYPAQRGAAYGLAGIVAGKGISSLREFQIMSGLKTATESKKDQNARQGAFLGYELLSMILERTFEPYVIQVVPQLLAGFGDSNQGVREACEDAAKQFNKTLSSYGVQQILPTLLEGLDEPQWRSKKGACDMLGTMSHLSPEQLALRLPDIIPPLTAVLNDSHKEVRAGANRSLKQFGEVISNPEIKSIVNILLKALSDPTKYTEEALDILIKVQFLHYLDAPSLALVVRILERGLGDRSQTKRKAASIIANLAHLTERKDIVAHLPMLVAGLRAAVVDPVPATRATAAKALGSLVEKLGEDALPDLIPSLMAALKADTGAGDRFGSAQALSEVLAGLGTTRLEETMPTILQNAQSSKPSTREGFMSLFIYLPACFGNSFANYLGKIIPPILAGLADDIEAIRDIALRAGRLLVKSFATRAVDLLLPELERGLADDSHRIRLSSVELVGDLLFNLTGISGQADEEEEEEEMANEAGQSLLEALGEERRNKVLSALYICRCDTSGLVRSSAINVWKALVATPRTLKELVPTLTQLIIRRLASSNMEQKVIAGNALGELIRKAGEGVMTSLLPTLEEGLQTSTDTDARQGICIALRELIASASPDALEDYEKTLISVVRTALVDPDNDVREAAAEAFDSLQHVFGKKAVDQVLPHLLNLLRTPEDADNALSALLTLLTDNTRSNIILPNLLPTLLTSPMSAFNARAIASLAEVASTAMVRRLPNILNALMDNIISCKDEELKAEFDTSFDTVLLSVDEFDGLNTAMSVMLGLAKHDDHRRRCVADVHLAKFFAGAEVDMSRYYPDLIRALLIAFGDSDIEVVKAAWTALNELTKRLRKEEMESLVISTRQVLQQVGVPGSNLPGFGLPKGINAVLPIFLQGLMNGTAEQRTQAALAISEIIDRTNGESLRPFVTQITGPLIRVVSERSVEVKAAILFTLNNLLEKIPTYLKPFLPQLQRTFAKSLADTSSETLRIRAAKALGTLITMTPRIDPLIAELVTGSKTPDPGVKRAMLDALYEVVSKSGGSMNEASRTSILGLIDTEHEGEDDSMATTNARLLGALVKVLPSEVAASLLRSRVLTSHPSMPSVLALNAILVDSPEALTESFGDETVSAICGGISDSQPDVADNSVKAACKYLLTETSNKSFEIVKQIFEKLAAVIQPGNAADTRRLALVLIRTVGRRNNELVRPHLALLAPPIFASVRDMVVPVKLAAEAALLAVFSVVEEESVVFDKYMTGSGASLPPNTKRSMQDYFKRIALRLGNQARERRDAEGGQGGLGLASDEVEDEREMWSVGKVDLGESSFGEA
ncbi:translational activator [Rhizodiscina lignyota]|uniref:eIF-2-alpha kinase activator GCN1 n=1 Tax=Rhizodiscina lignyota TaxID=1504668 RepID=A0A9P4MC18_9PEZI|nr:translational activator [Rhizodiscina lignyota]